MDNQEARLRKIRKFVNKMPSLSTTVSKVLEICSRPDTAPNDLNKVISLDPVLTGQVLKLINSAYYSLVNKVTSLTRAIIMLGLNTVKNLALSTAIIRSVGQTKKSKVLPIQKFWAHSIWVSGKNSLLPACCMTLVKFPLAISMRRCWPRQRSAECRWCMLNRNFWALIIRWSAN